MTALALAPMHHDTTSTDHWTRSRVNPLQQLLADAMREAGMPLERRGSKAELARRSGVEDAIISNLFNRPRYVPDEGVRQSLATALGIPRTALDSAAAGIKGLRVYTNPEPETTGSDVVERLNADVEKFFLALNEMSDEERQAAVAEIDRVAAEIRRRAKKSKDR